MASRPSTSSPTNSWRRHSSRRTSAGLRVAHATRTRRTIGVVVLFVTVAFGLLVSLAVGSKSIPLGTVIEAFTTYDSAVTDHLIVRDLRLPRTILAVLVGAALGVAGALMQGVTRNPLADPGLLGVNAGAAFAVVLAIWAFDTTEVLGLVWFAFVGAAITSVLVYALGSMGRGGANPVRLALAGAALSALLGAFTGRGHVARPGDTRPVPLLGGRLARRT